MTSRERVFAAWNGSGYDHPPLTTWCFGFRAPPHLRWSRASQPVARWYSLRMEHIHTLPQPWGLDDDFRRALAWQSIGVDDVLDVSVPWGIDPRVTWEDTREPPRRTRAPGAADGTASGTEDGYPVLVRTYATPAGPLRHAVRQTGEDPGEGWVVQPDHVPLIEDYNIPRAVQHLVSAPEHVPALAHLYRGPDDRQREWFRQRMEAVRPFADEHGLAAQAWSAFGMDALVWFMGVEGAIYLAMDHPEAFAALLEIIGQADRERTALAATTPGVDLVVERGWYSSTDLWSPAILDRHLFPHIRQLAEIAHAHQKKFGYVMTTGVEALGARLADAGVDVLYFVDPVQDTLSIERARELLGGRLTLVGAINSTSFASAPREEIRNQVREAMEVLGPTGRFILHPVDALHPDTPWEGMAAVIQAWKECW